MLIYSDFFQSVKPLMFYADFRYSHYTKEGYSYISNLLNLPQDIKIDMIATKSFHQSG